MPTWETGKAVIVRGGPAVGYVQHFEAALGDVAGVSGRHVTRHLMTLRPSLAFRRSYPRPAMTIPARCRRRPVPGSPANRSSVWYP